MQEAELHQQMLTLMQEVEAEMRRQGLWASYPPSPEAMASRMPFMYDTLKSYEWLQWVFIPRTRALIDARGQLPGNCNIHPLAEHHLAGRSDIDGSRLLELILQIDKTMSRNSGGVA
ncbi:MAG: YqcC family protein [Pedobacter sp.]|nr:YqcC family protein [Pedobacter sp.]